MEQNDYIKKLKKLQPFNRMGSGELESLVGRGKLLRAKEGTTLFRINSEDEFGYWLISGAVDFIDGNKAFTHVEAGSPQADVALNHVSPHDRSAVVTADAVIFKIAHTTVELMMDLIRSGGYLVKEVHEEAVEDGDWMTNLLSSSLFQLVPPNLIQQLFTRFEEMPVSAGDVVVREGDSGEYFYIISRGRARVEQGADANKKVLATLGVGATFGEDALISDSKRNASVIMATDGLLMRLAEEDFESLLEKPTQQTLDIPKADAMAAAGKAQLLDVGSADHFQGSKRAGDAKWKNIPLLQLRDQLKSLDGGVIYAVADENEKIASLAAFILNDNGFDAYVVV